VVSAGELVTATEAGANPDNIYFHGNNKAFEELTLAVEVGCRIVVDNWLELKTLGEIATQAGKTVPILLRVTPGIECHTHEYIRTGHLDSKFGFDPDQIESVFEFLAHQPQLHCLGVHAHIGSQIFELNPHTDLGGVMAQWMVTAQRYGLTLTELDVGGGLGIRYTESDDPPSIDTWVKTVCESVVTACEAQGIPLPRLLCEPGRSLIGSACVTTYRVGSQKVIPGLRTYVSMMAACRITPAPSPTSRCIGRWWPTAWRHLWQKTVTLAGKHCESGDILIKDAALPELKSGDVVTIAGTGAYNYSMASNYNRVPRPAAVLVAEGNATLIIRRETVADLLRQDCLPETLRPKAKST
jgi:diaminopimelate decarboxylase